MIDTLCGKHCPYFIHVFSMLQLQKMKSLGQSQFMMSGLPARFQVLAITLTKTSIFLEDKWISVYFYNLSGT